MGLRPLLVTGVATIAVLWPLARTPASDGFPLSNYPMFTELRPRVTTIDIAVGLDNDGVDVRLDPKRIGGSVEVIQAAATVERAVAQGRTAELCSEIAARVANDGPSRAQSILVVTDTYDTVSTLAAGAPPIARVEHATCEVER